MVRPAAALLVLVGVVLAAAAARAQVADLDLRSTFFLEPSPDSDMTVIAPGASLAVTPWDFLSLNASWEADIVTGATESVKAGPIQPNGPDIVTQASITDFRNVATGGFTIRREQTTLSASYSYGTESDYRSQAISVSAGADFFQRNTQIVLSYSHAFDEVCNQGYDASLDPTLRLPLDSSDGCFTSADNRRTDDVDQDNFQGGWTQAWTPVFTTQLVLTGSIQNGFLANPYRGVVIGSTGEVAQEHHPDDRARAAAALRARLYVKPIETAFGIGGRIYRDTWDISSGTVEADVERYLFDWLRLKIRGRYYQQTEALFWSDDYTGGEPEFGPRGQYWSGDRELSPLSSFLVGGRIVGSWQGERGKRIGGMFLELRAGGGVDLLLTDLQDFTWGGRAPNDTTAIITQVNVTALF